MTSSQNYFNPLNPCGLRLQITAVFPKILPPFSIFFGSLLNLFTSSHNYGYSCKEFGCERPGDFMFTCLSHQAIYKFFGKIIALSYPKRMGRCKAITLYKLLLSSYLSIPFFSSKINYFSHGPAQFLRFLNSSFLSHLPTPCGSPRFLQSTHNHFTLTNLSAASETKLADPIQPNQASMSPIQHPCSYVITTEIAETLKFQHFSPLPGNHCEL